MKSRFLTKQANHNIAQKHKMDLKSLFIVVSCSFFLAFSAMPASAYTYSFYGITHTNDINESIAESQITVDVTPYSGTQVSFEFTNSSDEACSLTDVYFDDGSLLGIAAISSSTGVSFSELATPSELPAANEAEPDFETTVGFSADSNPPVTANGVDQSAEWLKIIFNLEGGQDFDDVIDALSLAGAEGGLRIGVHIQGFEELGLEGQTISESLINNPVPIPSAIWLLGSAFIGLVGFRRKFRE